VTLPSGLTVDAERAEVRGPAQAIHALLTDADAAGDLAPPLLAAGIRAARAPTARFRVTGLAQPVEALADAHAAALLLPLGAADHTALRACTPSGLLGLLVRAVGLGPRPRPAGGGALSVPATRMAPLVAERSAAAAGLDEAQEQLLQEHLDALAGHWRIEVHGPGTGDGPVGWYLEVLDSERGLWTVADAPEGRLTLTPTHATAVLDELAALPAHVGLANRS
jgi:hypothetical protein